VARIARKSDGRRIFTDEFKRKHVARLWRGELTVAELGRKLGIARSLLQRWKRLIPPGPRLAAPTGRHAATSREPGSGPYVRELELLVGKQTVELVLLRAELDLLRRERRAARGSKR
jgi:transposase-like protein